MEQKLEEANQGSLLFQLVKYTISKGVLTSCEVQRGVGFADVERIFD